MAARAGHFERVALALLWVVSLTSSAEALTSYGPARPLSPLAASDGTAADYTPAVASTGNGSWVAVWSSWNDLGGTLPGDISHVFSSRSDDDGETWTVPEVVAEGATLAATADVASDGQGVAVIVVWRLEFEDEPRVSILRSGDSGSTWTTVASFGAEMIPYGDNNDPPRVATDRNGTWIAVWQGRSSVGQAGDSSDVLFSRSSDNGLTWSAVGAVNTDAASDSRADSSPLIVPDEAGTWLAAWIGDGYQQFVASSIDSGATWGPPMVVGSAFDLVYDLDLATDRGGRWLLAGVRKVDYQTGESAIYLNESLDAGSTWAALPASEVLSSNFGAPRLVHVGGSVWDLFVAAKTGSLVQTTGKESDIMLSRSLDDALTWTPFAALTKAAVWDDGFYRDLYQTDYDSGFDIASDGQGRSVAVWMSTFDFEDDYGPGNGIGDDAEILTANASGRCPPLPSGSCTTTTSTTGQRFRLRPLDGGRHKMTWKLVRGDMTDIGDLGDPVGGATNYAVCIYDYQGGIPTLVLERDLRAGAIGQRGTQCWSSAGATLTYRDSAVRNGAVKSLKLTSGAVGKAKLKMVAAGPTLPLPRMPFGQSPEVVVQLHNVENARCWESRFDSALANSATLFDAR